MQFDDEFTLAVHPEIAWPTLMDVVRVAPCLPGARIISGKEPEYQGQIKVRLGPVEMTYSGTVTVVERDDEQHRARINVVAREAKGVGGAKAQMTLAVHPDPAGTRVRVGSDFTVSGKAAQFGRGVMEEVSKSLMTTFAERLSALLAEDAHATGEASSRPAAAPGVEPAVAAGSIGGAGGAGAVASLAPLRKSEQAAAPEEAPAAVPEEPSLDQETVLDVGHVVGRAIARRYLRAGVVVVVVLVLAGLWWASR